MSTFRTLLLVPDAAFAQPLIVDTAGVEQALQRGAIVWDAHDADEHAAGHIPGAVSFGDVGDLFRDPNREDPPSAAVAAQLFGNAGIDILKREVVVYGAKANSLPYFGARMLEYYGGRHGRSTTEVSTTARLTPSRSAHNRRSCRQWR